MNRRRFLGICLTLPMTARSQDKIAPKPLFRDPVYDGAADPALIWSRADRKWLMFYTNRRASATELPGVSWVHGTKIGIAESLDHGATWRYAGTADIDYGGPNYTYWAPRPPPGRSSSPRAWTHGIGRRARPRR